MKKRSSSILVLFAILAVAPAIGGGCMAMNGATQAEAEAAWAEAEAFLRLCTTGQHDAAWESAAPSLRSYSTREKLAEHCGLIAGKVGGYRAVETDHGWRIYYQSPRTAGFDSTLAFDKGTVRMTVILEKVGDAWKVRSFVWQ